MQSRNTLLSTIFSTLPNIFIVYYIINPPAKVLKVLLQSPLESITLHYQEAVTWGICQNINSKFVQIFPYCIFFNHQLSQNTKWDRNVRTILSPANKKINKLFETRNCFKANNTSFLYSSTSLFQYNASSLIILYGEYKPASCERKPVHNAKLVHCIQRSFRSCTDIYLHTAKCIIYLGRGLLSFSKVYNKTFAKNRIWIHQ